MVETLDMYLSVSCSLFNNDDVKIVFISIDQFFLRSLISAVYKPKKMEIPIPVTNIKKEILDQEEQDLTFPACVDLKEEAVELLASIKQENEEPLPDVTSMQNETLEIVPKIKLEKTSPNAVAGKLGVQKEKWRNPILNLVPVVKLERISKQEKCRNPILNLVPVVKLERISKQEDGGVDFNLLKMIKNEQVYADEGSITEGVSNIDDDSEGKELDSDDGIISCEKQPIKEDSCGPRTEKCTEKELIMLKFKENYFRKYYLYFCNDCEFSSGSKHCLEKHILTHKESTSRSTKGKMFYCNSCEYKTTRSGHLKVHDRTHTKEKPFKCKLCACKYTQSQELRYHIMSKHERKMEYKCKICEYQTTSVGTLGAHTRKKHSKEKFEEQYNCSKCDIKFKTYSTLEKHFRRKHVETKPYKCKLCNCEYALKADLTFHMKKHEGLLNYPCNKCERKFVSSNVLKQHILTHHTTEKPYKCEKCKFSSKTKTDMTLHMRTHSGEKPYKCKFCNYACSQNNNLHSHMRTHSGDKPFSCEWCDYKVAQRSNLVRHLLIMHTENRKISCKFCSCKFTNTVYLNIHVRRNHSS